jgi:hypothetical protein
MVMTGVTRHHQGSQKLATAQQGEVKNSPQMAEGEKFLPAWWQMMACQAIIQHPAGSIGQWTQQKRGWGQESSCLKVDDGRQTWQAQSARRCRQVLVRPEQPLLGAGAQKQPPGLLGAKQVASQCAGITFFEMNAISK